MIWFGNLVTAVATVNPTNNNPTELARRAGWEAINAGDYGAAVKQFDIAFSQIPDSAYLPSIKYRRLSEKQLVEEVNLDRQILRRLEAVSSMVVGKTQSDKAPEPFIFSASDMSNRLSDESNIEKSRNGLAELTELALRAEDNHQQGLAASYWEQIAKQAKNKMPTGERDGLFALALANTSLGVLDAPLRKMAKSIDESYIDKAVSLEFLDKTYFEGQYLSRIGRNEEATSTLKRGLDNCLFMPHEHRAEQTMVALYRHYKERKQFYESYDLAVDGPAFVKEESTPSLLPQEMLNSKSLKAVYLAQLADYYHWLLENPDRTREMLAANPALAAEMRNKDFKTEMKKAAVESLLLTETSEAQDSKDSLELRTSSVLESKALSILCTQPESKPFLALKLSCALASGTADSVINCFCELAHSQSANKEKSDALMKCATEQLAASSGQIVWLSDSSLDAFASFAQVPQLKTQNTVASALQASADAAEKKYGKDSVQHCLQLRALGRFWLSLNPEKASAPLVQAWNVVRISKTFPLAARHDILEEYLEMLRKTGKTADATKLEPLLQAITES